MSRAITLSPDDVIALEKSYWDAMKAKDGRRTAELSADPSIVTGPRGMMSIPKDKMAGMTEDGSWTLDDYVFEDVKVLLPAEGIAIIAYIVRQTITLKGEAKEARGADSSVWIHGVNGWECHAHSETPLISD
jgi:hypothetical protein